jgi:hypothetical protein
MWPWSRIKKLETRIEELRKDWSTMSHANLHYQRVLETIDPLVVEAAQKEVCEWYRVRNRMESNSIWRR